MTSRLMPEIAHPGRSGVCTFIRWHKPNPDTPFGQSCERRDGTKAEAEAKTSLCLIVYHPDYS